MTGSLLLFLALMRLRVQFAGSLVATLVQTAQPALIQASSFVLNPINVFIQVSNVMVILNDWDWVVLQHIKEGAKVIIQVLSFKKF